MMDIYTQDNNDVRSYFECMHLYDVRHAASLKERAFAAMTQLEGWCTVNKASILIDLILIKEPQVVVEIGVFGGKSLIPMAFALKEIGQGKIFGIDPWSNDASTEGMDGENYRWWQQVDHDLILAGLLDKIVQFKLFSQIQLIRERAEHTAPIHNIDILHIDGNHSEESAYTDVQKWIPLVKRGGIIIFDDTKWITTQKAMAWLDTECIKLAEFTEANGWGIWIKP